MRLICGKPLIKNLCIYNLVKRYYNDFPLKEVLDTIKIIPTGRWRLSGDAIAPDMEVEFMLTWQETTYKISSRWWEWHRKVTLSRVETHEVINWISEKDITWNVPDNLNGEWLEENQYDTDNKIDYDRGY